MPIAVGTVGATLILMAGRFSSLSLVEGTYRVVEAGVILALSHLAGRSYSRIFRLAWSLTDSVNRSSLLLEVAHYVNKSRALDETLQNAAEQIRRLFGYRPAFFLYDAARGDLFLKVTQIFSPDEVPRIRFSPQGTLFQEVITPGCRWWSPMWRTTRVYRRWCAGG